MSAAVGLAVASDELRAVLVRDGAIQWAARSGRTANETLSTQLVALLAQMPASRWRRPRVIGAVGPSAVQVRQLSGLPPLTDQSALTDLVRESAGRFFLKNGVPIEVAPVWLAGPDSIWAAAFDAPVVAELAAACHAVALPLRAVLPAVVALGAGVADEAVTWADGAIFAEIHFTGGSLARVRRCVPSEDALPAAVPRPTPALRAVGEDGWRLADAYGAAVAPLHAPLTLRPGSRGERAIARRRLVFAGAACAGAALLAAIAPGAGAAVDALRAEHQLRAIAAHARDAASAEQDLRRMSSALAFTAEFAERRRSTVALLEEMARALPEGAALVTIRTDSIGGMLVLLAPHAARAVAGLDGVAGIATPEITGPVTRELVGTRELERATARFLFARSRTR